MELLYRVERTARFDGKSARMGGTVDARPKAKRMPPSEPRALSSLYVLVALVM